MKETRDARPIFDTILSELQAAVAEVAPEQVEALAAAVLAAGQVFVAGSGRTGWISRAFAVRLSQLGQAAHCVGDATTPAAGPGDLCLVNSASGETPTMVTLAERACTAGAKVATVTADGEGRIAALADLAVVIPAGSKGGAGALATRQPVGSQFEQALLVVLEAVVMLVWQASGVGQAAMNGRHANLE